MLKMRRLTILVLLILPLSMLKGQNDFFKDINLLKQNNFPGKSILIYSHFNGCPPCKRMDKEVLSLESVRTYLDSNFVCFQIFGFDSLENIFRKQYGIKGDPTFLFLNYKREELHRVVGYFSPNQFLNECRKINTSSSLSRLEAIFSRGDYDLEFLRNYVHAMERARELDSTLIYKYLDFIPDSNLLKREYFVDMLSYGYYEGIWDQPVNSRYYDSIKQAYLHHLFDDLREEIRNRLIFSLNSTLYGLDQNSPSFDSLTNELKNLETGDIVELKDLYSDGFFAFIEDRYPSFYFEYERAKNGLGNKSPSEVFENHVKLCQNNAAELNSLAWGIYEEKYSESVKTGIDLIKRAIEIKPAYAYYDTYAALLLEDGNLNEAKRLAIYAIELAKETNKDYSGTEKLLIIIDTALLDNKISDDKK